MTSTDTLWRGAPATFIAQVTDDQDEAPDLWWASSAAPCEATTLQVASWPKDRVPGKFFTVDAMHTRDPFCVWLAAVDRYGAAAVQAFLFKPANHPPVAHIEVSGATPTPNTAGSFPFLSRFKLSAASSSDLDHDELTVMEWKMAHSPPGSNATPLPCPGQESDMKLRCLASDRPGQYQIQVTVSDGIQSDTTITDPPLTVLEDRLPCIRETAPSTLIERSLPSPANPLAMPTPVELSIVVDDDLDPLLDDKPSSSQLHVWWTRIKNDDPPASIADGDQLRSLFVQSLDARPGDHVRIRVEVSDRHNAAEIRNELQGCTSDTCTLKGSERASTGLVGCRLRATWVVQYQ